MNEPYCFVSILFYVPPHVHVQHAVEKTKEGKVALRLSQAQKKCPWTSTVYSYYYYSIFYTQFCLLLCQQQ